MPRFAANLTWLFTELPLYERPEAARRAGFVGVEFQYPYDIDPAALAGTCAAAGQDFVMMNTPGPNWAGGPRGFAAVPGGEALFRRDFERALKIARQLRPRYVSVLSGQAGGRDAQKTMLANLRWAVNRAPHVSLTVEPVHPGAGADPGHFLHRFDMAAEIVEMLDSPNVGLLFDTFHAQHLTGDVLAAWNRHRDMIRHVQISGFPDRHEPGRCGIDFAALFRAIDESDFRGWVSAQYRPATTTEAGLGWLRDWQRNLRPAG